MKFEHFLSSKWIVTAILAELTAIVSSVVLMFTVFIILTNNELVIFDKLSVLILSSLAGITVGLFVWYLIKQLKNKQLKTIEFDKLISGISIIALFIFIQVIIFSYFTAATNILSGLSFSPENTAWLSVLISSYFGAAIGSIYMFSVQSELIKPVEIINADYKNIGLVSAFIFIVISLFTITLTSYIIIPIVVSGAFLFGLISSYFLLKSSISIVSTNNSSSKSQLKNSNA